VALAPRASGRLRIVSGGVAGATDAWRPQRPGRRNVKDVPDPLIEPGWEGERLLVTATDRQVRATGAEGSAVDLAEPLVAALRDAVRATHAVLDAHLTTQAARTSEGAVVADVQAPTAVELAGQMLLGRGRTRRSELAESVLEEDDEAPRALVVVDLLELDGDGLLDVPLLERKRLLESVLVESDLVRLGVYVRPPVDPWIGTWRALGFHTIVYKAANSRYRPGEPNDGWAVALIPQRS
jgi:hypothetical protein